MADFWFSISRLDNVICGHDTVQLPYLARAPEPMSSTLRDDGSQTMPIQEVLLQ
jgi:hypothetical protein